MSFRILALVVALQAVAPSASAFDILIGSGSSPRLHHVDGATGAIEGFLVPGCEDHGFQTSGGPRVGADGKIYVHTNGAIYRLDPATGEFLDFLPLGGTGPAFFSVDRPDGTMWVTVGPPTNTLVHVDTDPFEVIGSVGTPYPVGIAAGPVDGNLYVGSFQTNLITRHDPTTGASLGTFATTSGPVAGVMFLPDGRLCAVFPTLNEILCYDGTTGASLGSFIPPGDPRPISPRGPAIGPDGELWVSSNTDGTILRYDVPTGAYLGVFASGLDRPGAPGFVGDLPASDGFLPAVATTSGPAIGLLECGVRKYLGIPYAEAPSGDLRWTRPVRKAASPTPFNAFSHGPMCPQMSGSTAAGGEDCLKLSIWRPDAPPATPLPVLFFIHGGGLWSGAMGPVIDGTAFARTQNAIVVEAQYRLGALGFLGLLELAAEDANGSTGNYGFLDQLEALRWVRDNIAAFGGDPAQVTIAGQSAGGWSVCTLLASPLSDGLFRAGIVQSGSCYNARPLTLPATSSVLNDPFFGDTIYERGAQVKTNAGCSDVACLRNASVSSLVLAYAGLPRSLSNEQPVNPAIDGYVLTEQPVVMLRQGAADGRALMIGTVANESTWFSQFWESIITTPQIYETFLRGAAGNTRADALLPLYPANAFVTPAETFRKLIDDTILSCPTLDAADAAHAGSSSAWVYHLTYPPNYGPSSTHAWRRTFHGLDLYYVFGTHARLATDFGIIVGPDDAALSASMQNAWGSFVRTGVPVTTPAWPVYAPGNASVLQFDVPNNTVSEAAFRDGRCAAFFPVANLLDADRDVATYEEDNCPVTANTNQADAEADLVGDVCDNCSSVANARVAASFLAANPWATLTGGQRDDDHDGYGNRCDAKFGSGSLVNAVDLAAFRLSLGKSRSEDACGYTGDVPCAIFDLDEASTLIGATDLNRFRQLNGKLVGPKCPTCPLSCEAGASGSCN